MTRSATSIFTTFLLIAFTILASGHWYVAQRLVLDTQIPAPFRQVSLIFLAAMAVLILVQPVVRRSVSYRVVKAMAWPVWLWCGVWFLAVFLLGVSDIFLWLLGLFWGVEDGVALARTQARGVVSGVVVLSAISLLGGLRRPALKAVEVRLPNWPVALNGFSIVQLTDIHIGAILGRGFAQNLVDRTNRLSADMVVITGDMVDGAAEDLLDEVTPFADLSARHGVYFVTGNHDHYAGVDRWCQVFEEMGLIPLRNTRIMVGEGDDRFYLAGVDDHNPALADGDHTAHQAALGDRQKDLPTILLAHDPVTFPLAVQHGVDLQLSGHTHGGQLWPFTYLVRLAKKYVVGHYQQDASQLYVSRGTGFWGPPMRLFAPSEITVVTIFAS